MWTFILRRILTAIPLILGVATITFIMIHAAPGDPMAMYFGDPNVSPEVIQRKRQELGLDKPIYIQYVRWLYKLIQLDLGESIPTGRPVKEIMGKAIVNTLQLTIAAFLLDIIVGVIIGVISAIKQYSLLDNISTFVALFIYSMPGFWLSIMLILLFALLPQQLIQKLDMVEINFLGLNLSGFLQKILEFIRLPSSNMYSIYIDRMNIFEQFWDRIRHMILPVFVLGIGSAAGTARYMRGSLLEVIRQDYIRTARAKGLSERVVIFKHALRNAFIPIVTIMGLSFPFLLGGAVIVETIFAWPGMGSVTINAIFQRDYPVILGSNLLATCMVILGNLVADVGYCIVDPRIRYD